ncbi:MAG: radical SAM protein [Eggerthellaceae bacterium]|nr:radical SAM protein [Eggerthellaceae bacterium]
MMHYRGRAFRPPFEEKSLLIEATLGCSRDKCAFCSLYHDTPFSPSPMEDIESDIRFIGRNRTLFKRVFLLGGDPFALPYNRLRRIGELVGEHIPQIESIGCYASIRNILAKTPEQLAELAKLGYAGLNIGLETGLDDVLAFMDKGNTLDEAREALGRLNDAGIPFTLNLVMGLAGAGRGIENALANAAIVNEAQPQLIIVTALNVWPGTKLADFVEAGDFTPPTLREIIEEEAAFLRATDCRDTFFFGMHELNPVRVNGSLPQDREFLAAELEAAIARFPEGQLAAPIRQLVGEGAPLHRSGSMM